MAQIVNPLETLGSVMKALHTYLHLAEPKKLLTVAREVPPNTNV